MFFLNEIDEIVYEFLDLFPYNNVLLKHEYLTPVYELIKFPYNNVLLKPKTVIYGMIINDSFHTTMFFLNLLIMFAFMAIGFPYNNVLLKLFNLF